MKKTLTLSDRLRQLGYGNYQALYQDWSKNFKTFQDFADHHGISFKIAVSLINNAIYLYEEIEETLRRR